MTGNVPMRWTRTGSPNVGRAPRTTPRWSRSSRRSRGARTTAVQGTSRTARRGMIWLFSVSAPGFDTSMMESVPDFEERRRLPPWSSMMSASSSPSARCRAAGGHAAGELLPGSVPAPATSFQRCRPCHRRRRRRHRNRWRNRRRRQRRRPRAARFIDDQQSQGRSTPVSRENAGSIPDRAQPRPDARVRSGPDVQPAAFP